MSLKFNRMQKASSNSFQQNSTVTFHFVAKGTFSFNPVHFQPISVAHESHLLMNKLELSLVWLSAEMGLLEIKGKSTLINGDIHHGLARAAKRRSVSRLIYRWDMRGRGELMEKRRKYEEVKKRIFKVCSSFSKIYPYNPTDDSSNVYLSADKRWMWAQPLFVNQHKHDGFFLLWCTDGLLLMMRCGWTKRMT